jgi:hypothetical protein
MADSAYLYTINKVINIDNSTALHKTIISSDPEGVYLNIDDNKIDSQFRVVGGTWTDDLITRNIFSHNDDQLSIENLYLNIGCNNDTININSKELNLGTIANTSSITNLYGKTIEIGENDTQISIKMDTLLIGKENSSAHALFDETNKKIDMGTLTTSNINFTSETITNKASTTLLTETPIFNINENSTSGIFKINDTSGVIELGGVTTNILNTTGAVVTHTASSSIMNDTPLYQINETTDNVYLKMDDVASNIEMISNKDISFISKETLTINTPKFVTIIDDFVINSSTISLKGLIESKIETPLFTVNNVNSNVNLFLDENNSSIKIGTTLTSDLIVNSDTTSVIADTLTKFTTPLFQIDELSDTVYFNLDQANSSIQLGSDTTSILYLDGYTSTIKANTLIQQNTPMLNINNSSSNAYMNLDNVASSIQLGGITNNSLTMNGNTSTINSITKTRINTDLFELNDITKSIYIKAQESDNSISLGVETLTENINISSKNVTNIAPETFNIETPLLNINKDLDTARIVLDDANKSMTLGGDNLETMRIHGNDILIGQPGKTITLYGNLISYAEGSNIITNTVTDTTAAFSVHNTGTETALTVIQDNSVGGTKDLALFITHSNQDRAALRIDGDGRLGLGIDRTSNIDAWLHINRHKNGFNGVDNDMFRVDDIDNDITPFIITNNGRVGIGTFLPKYKVDIWNDEKNINTDISDKGVAIRDALYLKTDNVNKIFYNIGGVAYQNTDETSVAELGVYLSWPDAIGLDNTENDDTYVFRVGCKFHAGMGGQDAAYKSFETLIIPSNNGSIYPSTVMVTSENDGTTRKFKSIDCTITRYDTNKVLLKIIWTYRANETPPLLGFNITRAYLDLEILSHENLGDITIEKYKNLTIGNIL